MRLLRCPRGGKVAAQNRAVHSTSGEILGFTDANAKWREDALRRLVRNFADPDVALVIGANDVVNPDARNNAVSPIYGMPMLNVDESQQVVVLKRSMNPGFAGVDNPLFLNPKTVMLFGDAKDSITRLTAAVKIL